MKGKVLLGVLVLAFGAAAWAQDPAAPPAGQQQSGRGYGRGVGMGGGMGMGRGLMGTVTEAAPDHYTVKSDQGESWTVHYSANTRMMKQMPRPANAQPQGQVQGQGRFRGSPPEPIKATDIKVGDAIMAMGEMDEAAKSVGAVMVMELDPETAKRMEQMRANFGKTWLAGRVTAIKDTTVTLEGGPDNAAHSFQVDENTDFRKRREPITLGDIQLGDGVRVEGAVKDGNFVATTVTVMGPPRASGGPARRPGPPPQ